VANLKYTVFYLPAFIQGLIGSNCHPYLITHSKVTIKTQLEIIILHWWISYYSTLYLIIMILILIKLILLYKHQWNTRIFPFTKKIISSLCTVKILFLSLTLWRYHSFLITFFFYPFNYIKGYFKLSRESSRKKFVCVLFSKKLPQTIYQQKGYKM